MAGPEPGWYPDPDGSQRARYWDGNGWSSAFRALEPEAPEPRAPEPTQPVQPTVPPTAVPPRPTRPPAQRPGSAIDPVAVAPVASSGSRKRWVWVAVGVVAVLAAGVGGYVLASGGSSDDATAVAKSTTTSSTRTTTTTKRRRTFDGPDLALSVSSIDASSTRAGNHDGCSPPNPTSFDASNLQDRSPQTAWMPESFTPGSASVTLELSEPALVKELTITNGYPKTDPCAGLYRYFQYMRPTRLAVDLHNGEARQFVDVSDVSSPQTLSISSQSESTSVTVTVLEAAPPDVSQLAPGVQDPFMVPAIAELGLVGAYANG